MKIVKLAIVLIALVSTSCAQEKKANKEQQPGKEGLVDKQNLIATLDTIWQKEQTPIRLRDSLMNIHGMDSKEADVYQKKFRENHALNIKKIREILDDNGSWPEHAVIGGQGNITICNVLQHADLETREYYMPIMRQAVIDKKLEPRYLVRAEDRIATDKGELQVYGGQMKYYPKTKSFNVWPVFDPVNVDKRRAEIGLEPIEEILKNRFDFKWNIDEQIKRTAEFEKERNKKEKLTQSIFSIPFSEKEIKVDGLIGEDVWEQAVLVENLFAPWEKNHADKTKFRAFVSKDYFNFYFQVADNTLITVPFEKELSVASEDRVELFFSNDTTLAKYYCIEIDPKGNVLDYSAKHYREFNENWNFQSKKVVAKITDASYFVEGKISLKELNELGISNTFYLGIFRADFKSHKPDEVTWFSWIKPDSSEPDFHIPSAFGKTIFEQ